MKNRAHLDRLIRVLRGLDLNGVPTLVIDDEKRTRRVSIILCALEDRVLHMGGSLYLDSVSLTIRSCSTRPHRRPFC